MSSFISGSVSAISAATNKAVNLNTVEDDQYNYQNVTSFEPHSQNVSEDASQPQKFPPSYDHKDLWKTSASSESMIWQTVSEDDVYEDTLQEYYNREKTEDLIPNASQDVNTDHDFVRNDLPDNTIPIRQPIGIPEEPSVRELNSQTSFNSETSQNATFQPQSALKTEPRLSSEPKTVTFSDQVQEETISSERGSTFDGSGTDPSIANGDIQPAIGQEKNFGEINEFHSTDRSFLDKESDIPAYNPEITEVLPKARIRWLSAFNKVVNQMSEVGQISIIKINSAYFQNIPDYPS